MKRNFDQWMATFKKSVADWTYYTDFPKVYRNIKPIKIELNLLNSLINSNDIETEFIELVSEYPQVLNVVPILLAKRDDEIRVIADGKDKNFNFKNLNYSIDEYVLFMRKSGLFDLLENNLISDLTDYVKGVEVGLDTNARKNRTGKAMENIVESFIEKSGFIKGRDYFREMRTSEIKKRFGVDLVLSTLNERKAEKRFDFVVYHNNIVYAIETNFYSGGGSKLNETARSYKMLAQEAEKVPGFKFVWITDGIGWRSARRNLQETYDVMENIFNINDLEQKNLKELLR